MNQLTMWKHFQRKMPTLTHYRKLTIDHNYIRQQSVMIGSSISQPITLKVGSPQGAILSPTVFIILISDMELYCPEAKLCGYADDTSVSVEDKSLHKVKKKCDVVTW